MSSDPTEDDFIALLKANGFDAEDVTEPVDVDYTGASLDFPNEDGLPITVRVEFPVGHAMDAARALVLAGSADYVPFFLAGALASDDASVHGYMDANGIDTAAYVEATFKRADSAPDLSEADEFFNLDK